MTTVAGPRAQGATTAADGAARPGYLPAIDGLRALAVAAVVAFHLGHLRGGFLGVDVFFVISGFLITRLLLAEWERTGSIALASFWKRRFRRLLPALFVMLAVVSVTAKAWLPAWRLGDIRADALAALVYVANWRFSWSGQPYFAQGIGPSPLRHTWSLAIEEQFYLVWPLLVVGVLVLARRRVGAGGRHGRSTPGGRSAGRRAVGMLAAGVGLASAAWMAIAAGRGTDLSRVYYGTDTRVFALCAGAWVASWWDPWLAAPPDRAGRRRRARRCASAATGGLVVLAGAVVLVAEDAAWSYRGAFQVAAVAAAVAIAGLATGLGRPAAALSSAPLRWVGRRSYGIYLWAWPVQVLAQERFDLGPGALALVVVGVSVAAAAISFAVVEEPIRTGRSPLASGRWGRPRREEPRLGGLPQVPRTALAGVALVAVVAAVVLPSVGAPEAPAYLRTSDREALAAALAPAPAGPSTSAPVDPAAPFSVDAPLVVPADASADPAAVHGRPLQVLLTGDSVAWSLGYFLRGNLRAPIELGNRGIIACGLMPASADWIAGDNGPANYPHYCSRQAEADRLGLAAGPDVVVLWTGAWEVYDHRYEGRTYRVGTDRFARLVEGLVQARVDRYRLAGKGTILPVVTCFGPTPSVFGTERLDPDRVAWVNARLRAVAERNVGWVRMIDPTSVLCDPDGTAKAAMPDGKGIRVDGAHFDENSAPWFWNTWLAGQLAAAVS